MAESSVNMAVDLGGVKMQNPVNTASGTFGFGWQFEGFFDVSRLGAITTKGCSAEPWLGNPEPRMCEVPSGMMNTVGLANPGVAGMLDAFGDYLRELEGRGCRVILQAAGHSHEEYIAAVEKIEELAPWCSGIELNISCPNIARGGALVGATPESASEVVKAVRDRVDRPLLVKMAPVRVPEIARACEAAGADALCLINTINGMHLNVRTRKSMLSKPTGGVSGPAIHAIAVRMVWEAANAVKIPINGMGGVATWEDAAEIDLGRRDLRHGGHRELLRPDRGRKDCGRPCRLGRRAGSIRHQRVDWSRRMLTYEQASDKVIIALDCSRERAFELADMLAGKATWVKVGMTLFYAEGPAIVEAMRERGLRVFLDLKVHDIPFQVQGAVRSAAMTGADIISIHGLGSSAMVSAARKGAEEAAEKCGRERCRLVAISVLTSMDQDALAEIGVTSPIAEEVARLASLSYGAGADGIVCSPQEAAQMRELLGPDALIVTPGVRPAGSAVGDQKRIATPAAAIEAGSSKLVVGRPITAADDPVAAFDAICEELMA